MEILAHGTINEENLEDVVKVLSLDHTKGFVANNGYVSHWWSIVMDGVKYMYLGSEESFEKWRRTN